MKQRLLSLFIALLGLAAGAQAASVTINATNFPDANFRTYVSDNFDSDMDGYLSDAEIAAVTKINVSFKSISNLTGIAFFTALQTLSCYADQLTALDVSKNTALEKLSCNGNQLTALDVSKNTALTDLDCSNNQLTALDVTKNTALTYLGCGSNQLTTLDVSKNTALKDLECGYNQLTALDISKNTALQELGCYNNQLTTLDVSKNTALKRLSCLENQLTTLISNNPALTQLYCYNNQLTALDVSKNTALTYLSCSNNQLTALDVSKNTALTYLSCPDNQLTTLDVSKNTALEILYCYKNQLRTLVISSNTVLEELYCEENQLTTLDVSKSTALKTLSCSNNQLTTLYVPKSTSLHWVVCSGNGIRGEGMQMLVDDLYDRSETWTGELRVYMNETPAGNEMTVEQVAAAKAKKWKVLMYDNDSRDWVDYPGVASAITLNKSEVVVRKNKTVTLKATVSPEIEDKSVKWKSSDKTIATVSSSGKVTGVKSGIVTITCTSVATGEKATCKVTVGTITLNKSEVVVRKKKSVTLKATVYPTSLEDKSVTWKSSDKTIATVSSSGKVTGVKSGVVTITCTSNATGLSTTCKVTVGTITLDKSEVIVRKKKTVTLTPTVYPTTLEDKSVTWKSSDESVATVSSDGVVTGIKSGVITITCTSNATGLSTTCEVTVATIGLNKSSVTIIEGNKVTLKPTVYPTTLEDKSVTWKSSNKAVATVSKTGKVTAIAAGMATITCTSVATGLSTTCKVTVTASASARTLDDEDAELTDIEIVEVTPAVEEPFDVYDLRGHQVLHQVTSLDALPAGVYIVKGKKVMKK